MSEQPNPQKEEPQNQRPVMLIPKSVFYIVGAIVFGSFILTLFVRNPYTQATQGEFYERGFIDSSALLWLAIFIGIPASVYIYKTWIEPLFKRR